MSKKKQSFRVGAIDPEFHNQRLSILHAYARLWNMGNRWGRLLKDSPIDELARITMQIRKERKQNER